MQHDETSGPTRPDTFVTLAGHGAPDGTGEGEAEAILLEDLVEEISIDGMCGVY